MSAAAGRTTRSAPRSRMRPQRSAREDDTMTTPFKPSRRDFLKASGLVIGFSLPIGARLAQAAEAEFKPNAYLQIGSDNVVTVVCGLSEMGQGVHTAIPMLVAEELDANWSRVRVVQAPVDQAFANPIFHTQATGGSTSVPGHWEPMRPTAGAGRQSDFGRRHKGEGD